MACATYQFSYEIRHNDARGLEEWWGYHLLCFERLSNFKVNELLFTSFIFIQSSIEKGHFLFAKLAKNLQL